MHVKGGVGTVYIVEGLTNLADWKPIVRFGLMRKATAITRT
jgi:hypothetical protein